jgi:hypothetical protein
MESISIVLLEEDSDDNGQNLKELCQSLQQSSLQLATAVEDTYQHFKLIRRKVKEEEHSLDKLPLKPRAHTRKWLEAHGLPEQCNYADFFTEVLNELSKEDRLDLSRRTLVPNASLAALVKIPVDVPIHIMDFISLTPTMFH